jgi:hypothetical protein
MRLRAIQGRAQFHDFRGRIIAKIDKGARGSRHPVRRKRRVELEVEHTLSDQLLGGLAIAGSQLVTFGQFGNDGGVYGVDNKRSIAPGCEKTGPARRGTAIDVEANIQVTIAKSTDKFQHRIDILIGGIDRFGQRHLLFKS